EAQTFYHDVPPELAKEAMARGRRQSSTAGSEPWPLERWPDVPVRFVLGRNDRFFRASWLRGVVRDRLGLTPDELDSGHCPALSIRVARNRHPPGWHPDAGAHAALRPRGGRARRPDPPSPSRCLSQAPRTVATRSRARLRRPRDPPTASTCPARVVRRTPELT